MKTINGQILTSLISAIAIIIGSLLGALFTWIITNKTTSKNIEEQHKILLDKRKQDEIKREKEIYIDCNNIRLDIYNAIFQSIRALKYSDDINFVVYPITINKDYSKTIAAISEKFSLRELSYIYQFYGIIERLNNQILLHKFGEEVGCKNLLIGYSEVLKKVYGNNYKEIMKYDIETLEYIDLVENNAIKLGYKNVLSKLNKICKC